MAHSSFLATSSISYLYISHVSSCISSFAIFLRCFSSCLFFSFLPLVYFIIHPHMCCPSLLTFLSMLASTSLLYLTVISVYCISLWISSPPIIFCTQYHKYTCPRLALLPPIGVCVCELIIEHCQHIIIDLQDVSLCNTTQLNLGYNQKCQYSCILRGKVLMIVYFGPSYVHFIVDKSNITNLFEFSCILNTAVLLVLHKYITYTLKCSTVSSFAIHLAV